MKMATTVVLSKDGYDFAHEVEYMEDGTFKIRVFEDHDYDALDEMMK